MYVYLYVQVYIYRFVYNSKSPQTYITTNLAVSDHCQAPFSFPT